MTVYCRKDGKREEVTRVLGKSRTPLEGDALECWVVLACGHRVRIVTTAQQLRRRARGLREAAAAAAGNGNPLAEAEREANVESLLRGSGLTSEVKRI